MHSVDQSDRSSGVLSVTNVGNFLQFLALLLTIVALAMHGEGRIAALEQHLDDMEKSRQELIVHIDRIEARLDAMNAVTRESALARR